MSKVTTIPLIRLMKTIMPMNDHRTRNVVVVVVVAVAIVMLSVIIYQDACKLIFNHSKKEHCVGKPQPITIHKF